MTLGFEMEMHYWYWDNLFAKYMYENVRLTPIFFLEDIKSSRKTRFRGKFQIFREILVFTQPY